MHGTDRLRRWLRHGLASAVLLLSVTAAVALGASSPAIAAQLNERGAFVVGGEPKYLLADPAGGHLFVSDFEGGSVAQVDLVTGLVARRFPVSDGPVGLALSADGHNLYVASYFGNKVLRFDLGSGALEATLNLGEDSLPWDLKLVSGPGGRALLAVTEHHNNCVSFFDAGTLARVASLPTTYFPYQMDVDVAGRRLYVAGYGGKNGGELLAVDLATLTSVWVRPTGSGSFDVRADPARDRVLVTDFVGKTVTAFNTEGTTAGEWRVFGDPKESRFSADGSAYFAAVQTLDTVVAFDTQTGSYQYSTPVGARPGPMTWTTSGSAAVPVLAVGNQGDGTVSLLSVGDPVPEFTDVPADHRFHREIRVLALRGALNGYPDGGGTYSFRPDDTLTRAQIAKILVGSLGLHTTEVESAYVDFTDVPADTGSYPFDYVQEAARKGIVSGLAGSVPRFGPYQQVTRIQLIRMAVRAAEAVGSPLPVPAGGSPFGDVDASSADFPYVMAAYAAGLVAGAPGPDGVLRLEPDAFATRGQTAYVVFALLAALQRSAAE